MKKQSAKGENIRPQDVNIKFKGFNKPEGTKWVRDEKLIGNAFRLKKVS